MAVMNMLESVALKPEDCGAVGVNMFVIVPLLKLGRLIWVGLEILPGVIAG